MRSAPFITRVMSERINPVYGLLLAGGRGLRLGRKKDNLRLSGKPLITQLSKILSDFTQKNFLSLRLGQKTPPYFHGKVIRDRFKNNGPFGAIFSALLAYPGVDWIVVACDLVSVEKKMIQKLVKAKKKNSSGVVFTSPAGIEPLCAYYGAGLLPLFRAQFSKKNLALYQLIIKAGKRVIHLRLKSTIHNVNTPEDLAANPRVTLAP